MACSAANVTAVRVRRDILSNSDVGAVLPQQGGRRPRYNRVGGVDANFRFGYRHAQRRSLRRSTSAERSRARHRQFDFAARGLRQYQDRSWQFRGAFDAIGEQFENDLGFVSASGRQ